MRMPRLLWLAILFMLEVSRFEQGINAQRTRDYERSAALRFIELHGLDTFEAIRGDGV